MASVGSDLFAIPWTVAHQAPLSMGFSRPEHCSGLPSPPPGDLPHLGIKPKSLMSPALAGRFFTTSATWEAPSQLYVYTDALCRYMHTYISWVFFSLPPRPTPLGQHRAEQLPTSFYTQSCIYASTALSVHPALPFPGRSTCLLSASGSLFLPCN